MSLNIEFNELKGQPMVLGLDGWVELDPSTIKPGFSYTLATAISVREFIGKEPIPESRTFTLDVGENDAEVFLPECDPQTINGLVEFKKDAFIISIIANS
ncbi:hypothetical protein ACFL1M_02035 [Patescibacteria group bacterium]